MHVRFISSLALAAACCVPLAAQAETVEVGFTRLTGLAGVNGTAIFRADLSGLTLAEIQSITLIDSNSRTGGSPGQYSGFDLDAIKLSTAFATTASGASAATSLAAFDFSPAGTFLTPGTQRAPADAKLHGTDASGAAVDAAFATLGSFDAVWFGTGSVTLGDGGRISFNLSTPVSTAGLYLYIGEVSGDPGESIAGSLLVSSAPVPEPSTYSLLLGGLGAAGYMARRRRAA